MDHEKKIEKCSKYGDIILLEHWLEKQPHLPRNVEKEILAAFVYGTKSLESAKKRLDKFFTLRGRFPKLFQDGHSDLLDASFRDATLFQMCYLPKQTTEGYCIMFLKFLPGDMDKFSYTLLQRRVVMLMELGMHLWPDMAGLSMVFDTKGLPKSFLAKMNPPLTASYFTYFQDAYPIKLKKMIIFNAPTFANVLINVLIKPFMKPKVFQRVQVSEQDASILDQYYDVETLPSDYGGKEESMNVLDDKWYQQMMEHRNWFKTISMLVADETKRPPDEQDTYGVQGTFRTLAID